MENIQEKLLQVQVADNRARIAINVWRDKIVKLSLMKWQGLVKYWDLNMVVNLHFRLRKTRKILLVILLMVGKKLNFSHGIK